MKNRCRYFATTLIVSLSIGIFAIAGFLQAAEDKGSQEGMPAISEGAKKMMDGNKMIMDIMNKKGVKDPDLTSAAKMMMEGYDMLTKGESMMTGSTTKDLAKPASEVRNDWERDMEGSQMVRRGAKTMLQAQKATAAAVEKHGMVQECSVALGTCTNAEKEINKGALDWFFGGTGGK